MKTEKMLRTYEPLGHALGFLATLRLAWDEIVFSRHVIWHLFKRDFVAQFRQKIMGYCWIVIAPLMGIVPFVFLHRVGIFNPGQTDMPYPVFIVMGMGIWGFLTSAFSVVSGGLQNNQDLIMRTNIPKITFAITGMANLLYNLIVHCLVVAVFLLIMGKVPSAWAIVYPLALLPIIFFGVGLGLMFSVIGTVARDLSSIMATLLNLLMFVSSVVYQPDFNHGFLKVVTIWNPFTYLVDCPRTLFVSGHFPHVQGFAWASLFAVVVLFLGIHSFYLVKDKVAERL
jgi:ABC-type polysaccharide/polyol phosphate export permease